jgi:hypothetical protein
MGDIGIPRESLSYLSDCLYSQDDEQNKDTAPVKPLPLPLPHSLPYLSQRDPKEFLKRIDGLLKVLRQHVMSSIGNGGKPYHILTTSAKLTRLLDGVRSTSCKSAKDRTGMSVTLEEVTLVRDIFGINGEPHPLSLSLSLTLTLLPLPLSQIMSHKTCWISYGSTAYD